jgi:hypothetical protein
LARSKWPVRKPPSLASQLLQLIECTFEKLVGWEAAIASRLAPTEGKGKKQKPRTPLLYTTHQAER